MERFELGFAIVPLSLVLIKLKCGLLASKVRLKIFRIFIIFFTYNLNISFID